MSTEHLSDMDIASLVAGAGSAPGRAALSEHLAGCGACRERLEACLAMERLAAAMDAEGAGAAGLPPSLDEDARERLRHAFRETVGARRGGVRRFVLRLLSGDQEVDGAGRAAPAGAAVAPIPWQAQASGSGLPEALPVLATTDGRIRVRFRRTGPDQPLRAYLLAAAPITGAPVKLRIPSRSQSFTLGPDGTAELPGIEIRDITSGVLEIELQLLEPQPGD